MTTQTRTVDAFPVAPEALGLPGEAELARLAARMFNEAPGFPEPDRA